MGREINAPKCENLLVQKRKDIYTHMLILRQEACITLNLERPDRYLPASTQWYDSNPTTSTFQNSDGLPTLAQGCDHSKWAQ